LAAEIADVRKQLELLKLMLESLVYPPDIETLLSEASSRASALAWQPDRESRDDRGNSLSS
jgi:hypothetical protein